MLKQKLSNKIAKVNQHLVNKKVYKPRKVWEQCYHCNTEVKIPNDKASKCPECGNRILPCSMCNMDEVKCSKCPYEKKTKVKKKNTNNNNNK